MRLISSTKVRWGARRVGHDLRTIETDERRKSARYPDQILTAGQRGEVVGDELERAQGANHAVDGVEVAFGTGQTAAAEPVIHLQKLVVARIGSDR